MSEARIQDLVDQWEEARERGDEISTVELCRDNPDLLPTLERRVQALRAMDSLLFGDEAGGLILKSSGRYRETDFLAAGGLGELFVAKDTELHRDVALKRIQPRWLNHSDSRARFELEAKVTGSLEHPGIIPVYGFGVDADSEPYYAMRLIQGSPLGDVIDEFHSQTIDSATSYESKDFQRLVRTFLTVCQTVAYAHSRGVIHRDIKPANVMVGDFGETLLVDWGLAKVVDDAEESSETVQINAADAERSLVATLNGTAKGSPVFMSPEQACGDIHRVGIASDIYSLGATLYILLTGARPVTGNSLDEILERVQSGEFARPSAVRSHVPRALEAICLKAMSHEPSDRYNSAAELADDIDLWLADKPVSAWTEPLRLRMRRWIRKHRTLVTSTAATLVVAVIGLSVVAFREKQHSHLVEQKNFQLNEKNVQLEQKRGELALANGSLKLTNVRLESANGKLIDLNGKLNTANTIERRLRTSAEWNAYVSTVALAYREWKANNLEYVPKLLNSCQQKLRGWEWHFVKNCLDTEKVPTQQTVTTAATIFSLLSRSPRRLVGMAVSGEGVVVTGYSTGSLRAWRVSEAGKFVEVKLAFKHPGTLTSITMNKSGTQMITTSRSAGGRKGAAVLWDLKSWRAIKLPYANANDADFHPQGRLLAFACEDGRVRLWDTENAEERNRFKFDPAGPDRRVNCVAFSHDGKQLIAGGRRGRQGGVKVWDVDSGKSIVSAIRHSFTTRSIKSSPTDPATVASIGWDRTVQLWNPQSGHTHHTWHLADQPDGPSAIVFSPDGKRLFVACADRIIRVFDVQSGKLLNQIRGCRNPLVGLGYLKSNNLLLAADLLGNLSLRNPRVNQRRSELRGHQGHVFATAFDRASKVIATGDADLVRPCVQLWNVATGKRLAVLKGHELPIRKIRFSRSGEFVAAASEALPTGRNYPRWLREKKGKVIIWNSRTGKPHMTLAERSGGATSIAFSPSDRHLAFGSPDKCVRIWDLKLQKLQLVLKGHRGTLSELRYNSPGTELYVFAWHAGGLDLKVWDTKSGRLMREQKFPVRFIGSFAVSFDLSRVALAVSSRGQQFVTLWSLATGKRQAKLAVHSGKNRTVAFHPDGKRLVTAVESGTTKVWDINSGAELLSLQSHGIPYDLQFSSDGHFLAFSGSPLARPGEVWIWNGRPEK